MAVRAVLPQTPAFPVQPPQPAPGFRHVPPRPHQEEAPAAAAAEPAPEEETAEQRERSGERPASEAPRRKRDWGSIFQKTFDKINKSFSAAEDEEI